MFGSVYIVKGGMRERFDELRRMGIRTVMITGDNRVTRDHERPGWRHRVRRRRSDPRARHGRLLARRGLPRAHIGAEAMMAQIKAELLKLRCTRTTAGLVLGMIALIILFGLLAGLLTHADNLQTSEDQRGVFGVGSVAGIFSALTGVLLVTSEHRFGTIRPTFLFTPRRSHVIGAKLVASLLAGLVFGIVGEGLGFGIGYACFEARGIPLVLHGGSLTLLLLGTIAGTAFFGAIGVCVAAIVRNQIGSIVGLLAWGFIVENLLFAFVPSVGRFTPGEASNALAGLTTNHLLSPTAGGAVMVAWIVVLSAAGLALTGSPRRRLVDPIQLAAADRELGEPQRDLGATWLSRGLDSPSDCRRMKLRVAPCEGAT